MHIFISAGEPSGDLHGANLVRALKRLRPDVICVGFGGRENGVRRLLPALSSVSTGRDVVRSGLGPRADFSGAASRADRYFRHQRPDAVVLIDYPGFHCGWPGAPISTASRSSISFRLSFGVGKKSSWRVSKMRRWSITSCALCLSRGLVPKSRRGFSLRRPSVFR